jgi:hypothetical protein
MFSFASSTFEKKPEEKFKRGNLIVRLLTWDHCTFNEGKRVIKEH